MTESVEWLGEKTTSTESGAVYGYVGGLCESKHRINVGIVKIDGKIVPFESYIVVSFGAMDTAGGVIGGAMQAYSHYIETVGGGLADWSRDRGVVYGEGVEGGAAKYLNEAVFNIGGNAKTIWTKSPTVNKVKKSKYNPMNWAETDYTLYAEQEQQSSPFYTPKGFEAEGEITPWPTWGEFGGTTYQPSDAAKHKITITITNEFEGVKSTVFQNQLAGCVPNITDNECNGCCDMKAYGRYYIVQPGKWTVSISPLASGTCSKPSYDYEWTFDVPKPADWDEMVAVNPVQAMSTNVSQVLQDAGLPFYLSPMAIVGAASLVGGLLIYKIYKKKKMQS